jgi:hypothetical protein
MIGPTIGGSSRGGLSLVTACMRADGPYGALPLSDPAEGTPSQLCDNPTSRLPGLKAARTLRMTPNPSSPGFMGNEERRPQGGSPRRAHAARQHLGTSAL